MLIKQVRSLAKWTEFYITSRGIDTELTEAAVNLWKGLGVLDGPSMWDLFPANINSHWYPAPSKAVVRHTVNSRERRSMWRQDAISKLREGRKLDDYSGRQYFESIMKHIESNWKEYDLSWRAS